jgi:sigma-B regulation protein RsbU (phosphoserine phosphatase)
VSIRTKLVILLLGFTLGAMVLNALIELRGTAAFGRSVSAQTRAELEQRGERELTELVNGYRKILTAEKRAAELVLLTAAGEAERLLGQAATDRRGEPRVAGAEGPALFLGDLAARAGELRGYATEEGSIFWGGGVYDQQLFLVAEGSELARRGAALAQSAGRAAEAERLASVLMPLVEVYRRFDLSQGDSDGTDVLRYVALENGLTATYPAWDRYPVGFDPRQAPWYASAMRLSTLSAEPAADEGPVLWNRLAADPVSGRVVLTGSVPVRGPAGVPVGVAAVDIPINRLLDDLTPPGNWGTSAATLLVTPIPPEMTAEERAVFEDKVRVRTGEVSEADERLASAGGVMVIADRRQEKAFGGADATAGIMSLAPEILEVERVFADDQATRDLVAAMLTKDVGTAPLEFRGRETMWAWGKIDRDTYLAVAVPYSRLIAEAETLRAAITAETRDRLNTTIGVTVGLAVIATLLALVAASRLIRPILELRGAAERIAAGDFEARADVRTGDEIQRLGETFNAMVPHLADRLRLQESLRVASRVQQHLLPQGSPVVPGLEIAARSMYCDETGGDYFDFVPRNGVVPAGTIIAVGDVAGHGIDAALLMASARAILRSRAMVDADLCALAGAMNQQLFVDSLEGRFMTLYLLEVDEATGAVQWVSAGHDPALVYDPGADSFEELGGRDLPLGIEPGWSYSMHRRGALSAGQVVVLGTDGIWETRNAAGELFGKERLKAIVREHARGAIADLQSAVEASLTRHRGGGAQQDDITLVVLRVVGGGEGTEA